MRVLDSWATQHRIRGCKLNKANTDTFKKAFSLKPKTWVQAYSERENWHSYRHETRRRGSFELKPINNLGFVLTAISQTV